MMMTERTYRIVLQTLQSMKSLEKDFPEKSVEHEGLTFMAPEIPQDWKLILWQELNTYMKDHELATFVEIVEDIKGNEQFVSGQYGVLFWGSLKKGLKAAASQYEPF